MTKFVSDTDIRVTTLGGHVYLFKAGEPQEILAQSIQECRASGCYAVGETPGAIDIPDLEDEAIASMLQEAFQSILDLGDPNLLTVDGVPRKNEVKERVDKSFTTDQFDLAWEALPASG